MLAFCFRSGRFMRTMFGLLFLTSFNSNLSQASHLSSFGIRCEQKRSFCMMRNRSRSKSSCCEILLRSWTREFSIFSFNARSCSRFEISEGNALRQVEQKLPLLLASLLHKWHFVVACSAAKCLTKLGLSGNPVQQTLQANLGIKCPFWKMRFWSNGIRPRPRRRDMRREAVGRSEAGRGRRTRPPCQRMPASVNLGKVRSVRRRTWQAPCGRLGFFTCDSLQDLHNKDKDPHRAI